MVDLVFYGSDESQTYDTQLRCFCNTNYEIFIGIQEKHSPEIYIALDKRTAIRLSKELRKQIAIIRNEKSV